MNYQIWGKQRDWTSNNEDFMDLSITYIMVDLSDLGGLTIGDFRAIKPRDGIWVIRYRCPATKRIFRHKNGRNSVQTNKQIKTGMTDPLVIKHGALFLIPHVKFCFSH